MPGNTKNMDMTVGNPVKTVLLFAIPMAIGNLFQCLYSMCDSVIVGRFVGAEALAAVGATTSITHFLLMISTSLTNAFSVMMAQYFGAKQTDMVRKAAVSCIYIVLFSSILLGAVGFLFARPIMVLMQADPEILDDAVLYLRICVGFCIGQVAYNAIASILRAVGDSRTPLYFLIVSAVLNVVLNLLFVVVFRLGVLGVAVATVIAQGLSAAACILYTWKRYPIFHFSRQDLRPDWPLIGSTLVLGISMSFQTFITMGGDVIISARINSFGMVTVAAFTAVSQIMRFATMLFSSVAGAFSVYVGQNFGAGLIDRLKEGFRKVLVIAIGIGIVGALAMIVFGENFIGIFIDKTDANFDAVMAQAREYQIIYCLFMPFLAAIWMFNHTLRGTGEAVIPLVSGITEIVFKLGGALVLSMFIGTTGIWIGSPAGWLFGVIPSAIYYYSGRWQKNRHRLETK